MKRYSLVASYYNNETKRYEDEIEINLKGIELDKLYKIDEFTSQRFYGDIWEYIRSEINLSFEFQTLSIKHYINNQVGAIYMSIITNNPMIYNSIQTIKEKDHYLVVSDNFKGYEDEKKKLLNLILNKDLNLLNSLYSQNSYFSFLIRRHIESYFDDEYSEMNSIKEILKEFRKYTTFRNWIVVNEKLAKKKKYIKQVRSVKPIVPERVHTIDENEEIYEDRLLKDTGKNSIEIVTDKYNEENEEFLDEEEIKDMFHL